MQMWTYIITKYSQNIRNTESNFCKFIRYSLSKVEGNASSLGLNLHPTFAKKNLLGSVMTATEVSSIALQR